MDNQNQSKLIAAILEADGRLACQTRCHNIQMRNYGIREIATNHKLDQIIFRIGIYFSFYIQHYQFPISISSINQAYSSLPPTTLPNTTALKSILWESHSLVQMNQKVLLMMIVIFKGLSLINLPTPILKRNVKISLVNTAFLSAGIPEALRNNSYKF